MKPPTVMAIGWVWRPVTAAHRSPASFFMRRARSTTSRMAGRQRDDAAHAQEVRRDQHIDMQDMAVQNFTVEGELAQQHGFARSARRPELFREARKRGGGVTGRADAADAAGDMRSFGIGRPRSMASKKRGVSTTSKRHSLILPSDNLDDDIAMTFDTCDVMDINSFAHKPPTLSKPSAIMLFAHLIGRKHGIHRGDFFDVMPCSASKLRIGGVVGIGNKSAAGFARLPIGWANGFAAGACNRSQADFAFGKQAGILFELALDTQRIIRNRGLLP